MTQLIEDLVNIFQMGPNINVPRAISRNMVIRSIYFDYEITDDSFNIILITRDAIDICNGNKLLLSQFAEQILSFLNKNKNTYICIYGDIRKNTLYDIINNYKKSHLHKCKTYGLRNKHLNFKPEKYNIKENIILALGIGGIADDDGKTISPDFDRHTIQPIKKGALVPDGHVYIPDDYLDLLINE